MEETGITIHNGLPRRNIFLRENPDFVSNCHMSSPPDRWSLGENPSDPMT
jgi:hypothetical protein